jgi:hypothetical protein
MSRKMDFYERKQRGNTTSNVNQNYTISGHGGVSKYYISLGDIPCKVAA